MTRVHGTKRDDFVSARAGLTEHGANRGKGLIMLGATVHMDRGLNTTSVDELLRFDERQDGAVDECAPGSAGLGMTRIGQRTATGN